MSEENDLTCSGQGMGSPNGKIENIAIFLTRPGLHTIEESRRLVVTGFEDLAHRLNQMENGHEVLASFPCGADDIYYSILFSDGKGKTLRFKEPYSHVSSIVVRRGEVVYLCCPEPKGAPMMIFSEKYELALKTVSLGH